MCPCAFDEASFAFEDGFPSRYGRQRRVGCMVDHVSAPPLLVVGTRHIATLHERLARQMAKGCPVKLLPAPFQMQPVIDIMVWPRYRDQDPAHRWLREQILQASAQDC